MVPRGLIKELSNRPIETIPTKQLKCVPIPLNTPPFSHS